MHFLPPKWTLQILERAKMYPIYFQPSTSRVELVEWERVRVLAGGGARDCGRHGEVLLRLGRGGVGVDGHSRNHR